MRDVMSPAGDREKRGHKWLVRSLIFCPCHLPFSMAAIGFRHIRAATKDIDCSDGACTVSKHRQGVKLEDQ
jgi:hypothetical protein